MQGGKIGRMVIISCVLSYISLFLSFSRDIVLHDPLAPRQSNRGARMGSLVFFPLVPASVYI